MSEGIDTHKNTVAIAVVNEYGRRLAAEQVPNTEPGFLRLVELLESHRVIRVGIEGSLPCGNQRDRISSP